MSCRPDLESYQQQGERHRPKAQHQRLLAEIAPSGSYIALISGALVVTKEKVDRRLEYPGKSVRGLRGIFTD